MTRAAVVGLLARLEAAGVRLALSESGEGLRVYGEGKPKPEVMAEVRAQKAALLAHLRGEDLTEDAEGEVVSNWDSQPEDVGQSAPLPSSPPMSSESEKLQTLPEDLRGLLEAARADRLPKGAQSLASGLVMDLRGYVLAWADCWPHDGAHVLRRLFEAYQVWKPCQPVKLEEVGEDRQGAA